MTCHLEALGCFCGSNNHRHKFARFHQVQQAMHVAIAEGDGLGTGLKTDTHAVGCNNMGHLPLSDTLTNDEELSKRCDDFGL